MSFFTLEKEIVFQTRRFLICEKSKNRKNDFHFFLLVSIESFICRFYVLFFNSKPEWQIWNPQINRLPIWTANGGSGFVWKRRKEKGQNCSAPFLSTTQFSQSTPPFLCRIIPHSKKAIAKCGTKKPGKTQSENMAIIHNPKPHTLPGVLPVKVSKWAANPHATHSLHNFKRNTNSSANAAHVFTVSGI